MLRVYRLLKLGWNTGSISGVPELSAKLYKQIHCGGYIRIEMIMLYVFERLIRKHFNLSPQYFQNTAAKEEPWGNSIY